MGPSFKGHRNITGSVLKKVQPFALASYDGWCLRNKKAQY